MSRKSFRERVSHTERKLVIAALAKCDGSITRAARALELHPFAMRRVVMRLGLQGHLKPHKRPPTETYRGNAAWHSLADA